MLARNFDFGPGLPLLPRIKLRLPDLSQFAQNVEALKADASNNADVWAVRSLQLRNAVGRNVAATAPSCGIPAKTGSHASSDAERSYRFDTAASC